MRLLSSLLPLALGSMLVLACGSSSDPGGAGGGGAAGLGGAGFGGGGTSAGGSGGGLPTTYFGFAPQPSAQNAAAFSAASWYGTWWGSFYQDCGGGQARIAANIGDNQTFSEGIGYGMLLAVGTDDRDSFDKLWTYYQGRRDANGLMDWKINACTTERWGNFAATDGDEDVAMALIQANAKWGGYADAARTLITAIKTYETSQATSPIYLRPGDAENNGGRGEGVVNPSYFAPGYWHVWASFMNDPFWNQLADASYVMLSQFQQLTISGSQNLVPDWGMSNGTNPNNSGYSYDACRTPWRVAVDYVWFGDSRAQQFLTNISAFVDAHGGIASVPFDKNSAFLGAFALSGMAVSQQKADTYLNDWLSANKDDTPYFQSSLRGVYLLLATQNFPRGL